MKILHIIREKGHELAISTALALNQYGTGLAQSATGGAQSSLAISVRVTLLLIHDAVLTEADTLKGLEVFALRDDVEARGVKVLYPLVDYEGMLNMIFESDKVITW